MNHKASCRLILHLSYQDDCCPVLSNVSNFFLDDQKKSESSNFCKREKAHDMLFVLD